MKELQPTNPVNEQDIEDRINQFLQQNGGNRPIVSSNIFSKNKKTNLDVLNKIETLGDDQHSKRLKMLLQEKITLKACSLEIEKKITKTLLKKQDQIFQKYYPLKIKTLLK